MRLPARRTGDRDGVAEASLAQGDPGVVVSATPEDAGGHGVFIEPFHDGFRDGWRVRQLAGGDVRVADFGTGACVENSIANDVVCSGGRMAVAVSGGPGPGRVTIVESQAAGDAEPDATFPPSGGVQCLESPTRPAG